MVFDAAVNRSGEWVQFFLVPLDGSIDPVKVSTELHEWQWEQHNYVAVVSIKVIFERSWFEISSFF